MVARFPRDAQDRAVGSTVTSSRRRRSNSLNRVIPLVFFLIGCVCLALAVAGLGASFFLRGGLPGASASQALIDQVDPAALAPGTLLLPLTDVNAENASSAALDKAHLENAFAIVAYDPGLTAPARIGALLQLGARYTTAKDNRKATASYQAAALLATLYPGLSDQARLDTYQQTSAGLRGIGANDAARFVIDQAYLVAQFSPALTRSVRVRRLEQIADAYTALGANALAAQARGKAVELSGAPEDPLMARAMFVPAIGALPASKEIEAAKQTRVAAAQQLADEIIALKPGAELPADFVAQLNDALAAEDRVRKSYYDQHLAQVKDPAVQSALLQDRVNWYALKYRAARGAFGKSVGGEWHREQAAVADEWSVAWDEWFQVYRARAAAVPPAQNPAQARADVVRQELMTLRWGWYRGASEKDLLDMLVEVNNQLMQGNAPGLRLDSFSRSGITYFLLLPDELYGQGVAAMPK